jgi:hypothetical protein
MLILRGEVRFFTIDETVSDATSLLYKLKLRTTDGQTYLLNGYKKIDSSLMSSVFGTWKATTTLYTTITRLDGSIVGRGRLHISWRNFASQLRSFGTTGGDGGGRSLLGRAVRPSLGFLGYFARNLANYVLRPLSQLEYPDRQRTGYFVKVAPAQTITLTASDGVKTSMKVWAPGVDVLKKRRPVVMIPGASVDDQIFSLPTIPVNTVEYFTSRGYTVYVPTLRFGRTPVAEKGYTAYDARLDVAAAMKFVHDQHEGKMYVICHCVGSIATSIGLLDGTLHAEWIQGLTASQIFFTQRFSLDNELKAKTPLLPKLYEVSSEFTLPWGGAEATFSSWEGPGFP